MQMQSLHRISSGSLYLMKNRCSKQSNKKDGYQQLQSKEKRISIILIKKNGDLVYSILDKI